MKRFLTQLQPVDFGAIAKRGCFVYCYLRADGSPYYVGVASHYGRPTTKYRRISKPPVNRALIRVLRSGLRREEALAWERFYISKFGRKDLGTGCLRNLTDGGDGLTGPSAKVLIKFFSEQAAARYGFELTEWMSLSKLERGRIRASHYTAQRRAKRLGDAAARLRGRAAQAAHTDAAMAERYEVSAEQWAALDKAARLRAHARYRLGHRGAALFEEKLPQPSKPSRSAEHAKRYGITPDLWLSFSRAQKELVRSRFVNGMTDLDELLNFDNLKGRSKATAAHNRKQAEAAALAAGLAFDEWNRLTKNQRAVMQQYLARNKAATAVEYIARRGW